MSKLTKGERVIRTRSWQHRLKLKDVLDVDDEDLTPEVVAKSAETIHLRLEAFRLEHFPSDDDLAQISDEFHTIAFIDGPEGVADLLEFNAVLDSLYDWADFDRRLWVD